MMSTGQPPNAESFLSAGLPPLLREALAAELAAVGPGLGGMAQAWDCLPAALRQELADTLLGFPPPGGMVSDEVAACVGPLVTVAREAPSMGPEAVQACLQFLRAWAPSCRGQKGGFGPLGSAVAALELRATELENLQLLAGQWPVICALTREAFARIPADQVVATVRACAVGGVPPAGGADQVRALQAIGAGAPWMSAAQIEACRWLLSAFIAPDFAGIDRAEARTPLAAAIHGVVGRLQGQGRPRG
jgi:hypothetical protein